MFPSKAKRLASPRMLVTDRGPQIRILCRCSHESTSVTWTQAGRRPRALRSCSSAAETWVCAELRLLAGLAEQIVPWGPGTAEARVSRSGGWEWRLAAAWACSADTGAFHAGRLCPVTPRA